MSREAVLLHKSDPTSLLFVQKVHRPYFVLLQRVVYAPLPPELIALVYSYANSCDRCLNVVMPSAPEIMGNFCMTCDIETLCDEALFPTQIYTFRQTPFLRYVLLRLVSCVTWTVIRCLRCVCPKLFPQN